MARARNNQTAKTSKSSRKNGPDRPQSRSHRETDLGSLLPAPRDLVRRVRDEVDRLFQDFGFDNLTNSLPNPESIGLGMWAPEVELFERDGRLIVRADLPGLTKDDIRIDLTNRAITLEGERRQEHEENDNGYYRSERSYGRFSRRIPLPEGVDIETAEANFRNGVLELSFEAPERSDVKARKLEINDGPLAAKAKAAGR
jgi:HSP20 family protein